MNYRNDYGRIGKFSSFVSGGSGSYTPVELPVVYVSPLVIDHSIVDVCHIVLTDSILTIAAPINGIPAKSLTLRIKQGVLGTGTISWNGIFRFSTSLPPPSLTPISGAIDYLSFIYNGIETKYDFIGMVSGF